MEEEGTPFEFVETLGERIRSALDRWYDTERYAKRPAFVAELDRKMLPLLFGVTLQKFETPSFREGFVRGLLEWILSEAQGKLAVNSLEDLESWYDLQEEPKNKEHTLKLIRAEIQNLLGLACEGSVQVSDVEAYVTGLQSGRNGLPAFYSKLEGSTRAEIMHLILWLKWPELVKLPSAAAFHYYMEENFPEMNFGDVASTNKLCYRLGIRFQGK